MKVPWLLLAIAIAAGGCSSSPAEVVTGDARTTLASTVVASGVAGGDELVVERRPITDEELARLQGEKPLDCGDVGAGIIDYGPLDPDAVGDAVPDDALIEWVDETHGEAVEFGYPDWVPHEGWIELMLSEDSSVFVWPGGDWRFIVNASGSRERGIWRLLGSQSCSPAD